MPRSWWPHWSTEVRQGCRRALLAQGSLSAPAHADLVSLPVEHFRYVALAESLGTAEATLDARLSRAAGPSCEFRLPPTSA